MEEIKYEQKKVTNDSTTLAITKGYSYINKEGKTRYSFNDVYYKDEDRICRKHSNEKGDYYYNVELVDVVVETFLTKDGNNGSKVYPLNETPYLANSYEEVDLELLANYLDFKVHR